ncbi:uncharacterized protein BX664DRAFT_41802 [Halteromyces radiatus]|uniref:uncharacterized protein n=1 Tax=Halteromyces radiatus TaxID=101107 RepID=UPI00221FBF12|nr:uncharacterized protein BX664DRAFT_41802 [Halteromyces radiatus]KAI8077678.1 hypothetical protein BX664DRAFT_41802 [Halteromyces radiatus]
MDSRQIDSGSRRQGSRQYSFINEGRGSGEYIFIHEGNSQPSSNAARPQQYTFVNERSTWNVHQSLPGILNHDENSTGSSSTDILFHPLDNRLVHEEYSSGALRTNRPIQQLLMVCHSDENWQVVVDDYNKAIKKGPTDSCTCCDGLFFPDTMKAMTKTTLMAKNMDADYINKVFNDSSEEVGKFCATCHHDITKKKVPNLCLSNGLKFMDVPTQIGQLTRLEERLVAARHVFF